MGKNIIMKKEIYLILKGRIGNQLFMYAFARQIQKSLGNEAEIIIDDSEVISLNWEDSLQFYDLENVKYVHNKSLLKSKKWIFKYAMLKAAEKICNFNSDFMKKFSREKLLKPLLSFFGIFLCENGFMKFRTGNKSKYLLCGYFQSEKYFENVKNELKDIFSLKHKKLEYQNLEVIANSNTVCVSIKIEHNVGSSMYAVCGKEYWKEAINFIISKVPNPTFFICSDDISYVKSNLIDCSKYNVVFQDMSQPVYKSLAVMSMCKHFIIGNTTFGWWAQYLSNNSNKIVVAPNQWMLVKMPIDIYEKNWILIDVKKYLGNNAL